MNSFILWVGGKGKLLWIINKLMPDRYTRFIDVFGGSGTVTMCRPIQRGCMEVYNDFNGNLTNLFCCVKNRPMALLAELGFLPLNTRDDFNVLYKFFSKGEFTDDYLQEEMDLTEVYLKPPDAEAIRALMLERAPRGSIRRAADFFKLIRYSFSGGAKSFGGKPCDIRRFFHLIWECSRRLANVIVENKDFEEVIRQYDRAGAVIYCDPPYYKAESCYEVELPPRIISGSMMYWSPVKDTSSFPTTTRTTSARSIRIAISSAPPVPTACPRRQAANMRRSSSPIMTPAKPAGSSLWIVCWAAMATPATS